MEVGGVDDRIEAELARSVGSVHELSFGFFASSVRDQVPGDGASIVAMPGVGMSSDLLVALIGATTGGGAEAVEHRQAADSFTGLAEVR